MDVDEMFVYETIHDISEKCLCGFHSDWDKYESLIDDFFVTYAISCLLFFSVQRGKIQRYKMAVIGIISVVAEKHRNTEIDTMENRRNAWK